MISPRSMLAVVTWSALAAGIVAGGDWTPIGRLQSKRLTECSGLVKSRKHADIYWAHNDSGHPAALFAVRLSGEVVAEFSVEGAANVDWEDITLDDFGFLYVGDFGDNAHMRPSCRIYKIPEPDPWARPQPPVQVVEVMTFTYPDGPTNCEALFAYQNRLYLITKVNFGRCGLYELRRKVADEFEAVKRCSLPMFVVTGADVTADGQRLAVLRYGQLAVFDMPADLALLEKASPKRVDLPADLPIEACAFDGQDVIVAAESKQIWRITAAEIRAQRRSASSSAEPP